MTQNDIRIALVLMKSLKDAKLYMELLHYATSKTGNGRGNVVILSTNRRRDIAAVTGISRNNIPKHIASLKALGLIEGERSEYVLVKPSILKHRVSIFSL
jgi:DNA-binding MarR family transcriptional regulator